MGTIEDPFEVLADQAADDLAVAGPAASTALGIFNGRGSVSVARFHGFGHDELPLILHPDLPHEIIPARTTAALRSRDIGSAVVVIFEDGDPRRPIIVGVVREPNQLHESAAPPSSDVTIHADDDRFVVSAEREITLRCGEASITLTRAGKVIIKGASILSRATGHNKIKGAAVDIN
jgi:hypothetical protein